MGKVFTYVAIAFLVATFNPNSHLLLAGEENGETSDEVSETKGRCRKNRQPWARRFLPINIP